MKYSLLLFAFAGVTAAADEPPRPLVAGLKSPASVAVGQGGRVYVAVAGDSDGDGAVLAVENDKAVPFAAFRDDPRGMVAYQQWLFVVGRKRLWRIDKTGLAESFAAPNAFPTEPHSLGALAVDQESGVLYAADAGDADGKGAAVYRVSPLGLVSVVSDGRGPRAPRRPTALAMDGASHLLAADADTGALYRITLADGSAEKVTDGPGAVAGLAWDHYGRLFVCGGGRLFVIPQPGDKAVEAAKGFRDAAGLCLDASGKSLLIADRKAGTLTALPAAVPGAEIDDRPLPVQTEVAFPDLQWTDWEGQGEDGRPNPLRPIVLTHAGDGSGRVFVATEQGVAHVFPDDQKATRTKIFLDLRDRVSYDDNKFEEGLLGMAFHPRYKENGEFFVFYTTKKEKLTNLVSRFRVRKDDPDRADPDSEEVLLRIPKPYWNHDGGCLCFGPDGFLYFSVGDGGLGNDPYDNGRNLGVPQAKVMRIDVDHKDEGKNYAVPKDNPFVGRPRARPETWAYGLRNVWRMSFDRATGDLWAADVGQNLYEEIDLIRRGGDYGWNRREGRHPFGARGTGPREEFVEPVWEYDHDVGKCIIGGHVYHGSRLPELDGYYVYGDYVTARLWGLRYDDAKGRVVANRPIRDRGKAMFSFGEDEKGEVYLLCGALDGRGIYRFAK